MLVTPYAVAVRVLFAHDVLIHWYSAFDRSCDKSDGRLTGIDS